MIKVTTAHIVAGTIVVAGTATAVAGFLGSGASLADIPGATSHGLGQLGGFLKTTGILGLVVGGIFLLVKFNIVKMLMIQEGETGLLIRKGKVVLDKKSGLPRIVNPDRYQLHIAILRHIAIVSNRERAVDLGSLPITVHGVTWVAPLVMVWSINGDPVSMKNALIRVSDGNRFDEKFGALEKMMKEQATAGLAKAFRTASPGLNDNPPVIDYSSVEDELQKRAGGYGCHYHELLESPVYRYAEQHQKDGLLAIAEAVNSAGIRGILPSVS